MEMRYVCGLCGKSTTNPTTIDWCEECRRLVCRDCQPEHRLKHQPPG
jgi:hypothetical protein